jgi:hypothetical protein
MNAQEHLEHQLAKLEVMTNGEAFDSGSLERTLRSIPLRFPPTSSLAEYKNI